MKKLPSPKPRPYLVQDLRFLSKQGEIERNLGEAICARFAPFKQISGYLTDGDFLISPDKKICASAANPACLDSLLAERILGGFF